MTISDRQSLTRNLFAVVSSGKFSPLTLLGYFGKDRAMEPSEDIIKRFQAAYYEEFGEDISSKEASDELTNLVELLNVLFRPEPFVNLRMSDKIDQFDKNPQDATLDA